MAAMLPKLFRALPRHHRGRGEAWPGRGRGDGGAGAIVGFLCGFVSWADPAVGYIHFVGVEPRSSRAGCRPAAVRVVRRSGGDLGCTRVECVTSPANTGSRAFHARMGFVERFVDAFDGPGEPRMLLTLDVP